MARTGAIFPGGRAPLVDREPEALPVAEVTCDRLRRLGRIGAELASCAAPDDVGAAVERALELVPAPFARLVEAQDGGAAVVVAVWPAAAAALGVAGTPASAAFLARAPVWLDSPEAIAASAPALAEDAARLGAGAWGAVPVCSGAPPLALELGLAALPRADAAEREYLGVAARLLGGALLRARLARAADEGDLLARVRRHVVEMTRVLDAFSVGVALISADGEILALNRAAMDVFDVGDADLPRLAPELVARLAMAWPDGRLVALAETPFRRALRGEHVRDVLLSLTPRGQGRRWIVAGATPIGPPGAVHSGVLNLVDVTHGREVEHERASLLRHVVDELAPRLRAIETHARALHAGDEGPAAQRAGAEILRATRRLSSGLHELEAALRFDPESVRAAPELVDVKAFVLDLLEHTSEIDARRVIPALPPGLPCAHVDPDHLERIVLELLGGAVAGAPEGADVAIAAEAEPGGLRLTVASTGQDIEAADLPRIFDRFFKARGRPVGRLHLVRALAEANGARVAAESGGGRGLAISVVLPLRRS